LGAGKNYRKGEFFSGKLKNEQKGHFPIEKIFTANILSAKIFSFTVEQILLQVIEATIKIVLNKKQI
jgi:hypothetical protein